MQSKQCMAPGCVRALERHVQRQGELELRTILAVAAGRAVLAVAAVGAVVALVALVACSETQVCEPGKPSDVAAGLCPRSKTQHWLLRAQTARKQVCWRRRQAVVKQSSSRTCSAGGKPARAAGTQRSRTAHPWGPGRRGDLGRRRGLHAESGVNAKWRAAVRNRPKPRSRTPARIGDKKPARITNSVQDRVRMRNVAVRIGS